MMHVGYNTIVRCRLSCRVNIDRTTLTHTSNFLQLLVPLNYSYATPRLLILIIVVDYFRYCCSISIVIPFFLNLEIEVTLTALS